MRPVIVGGSPDRDPRPAISVRVHARLPVDISIDTGPADRQGHAEMRFAAVRASEAELAGAIPNAVSLHELRFGRTGGLWRCHVTVDT